CTDCHCTDCHCTDCHCTDRSAVLDLADDVALGDGAARLRGQPGDGAVLVRGDRVLHLHGLEYDDQVAGGDGVAVGDRDLDDGSLHGCGHGVAGDLRATTAAAALAGRFLGRAPGSRGGPECE